MEIDANLADILNNYAGETVGYATFDLMRKYHNDEISWVNAYPLIQFTDQNELKHDDIVPAVEDLREPEPFAEEPPTRSTTAAGRYLAHYEGDSIEFSADCYTEISLLIEDGERILKFEDVDKETFCHLRIDLLLNRLEELEEGYNRRLAEYEERKAAHEASQTA